MKVFAKLLHLNVAGFLRVLHRTMLEPHQQGFELIIYASKYDLADFLQQS